MCYNLDMKCPVCGTEMVVGEITVRKPKFRSHEFTSVWLMVTFGWIYWLTEILIWVFKWIVIMMWWMIKLMALTPLWYHGKNRRRYTCPIDGTIIDKKVFIK